VIAPLAAALLLTTIPSPYPHGTASALCGARTIPFQQEALALAGGHAWVACRDSGALVAFDGAGRVARRARLRAFHPWALAGGAGALWAIDRGRSELWRLDARTGRLTQRYPLPSPPASLWAGAGSIWVGLESVGFVRIDPRTGRSTATFAGDGVSAFATDGRSVFVVSHRDNAVARVALGTGKVTNLAQGVADPARAATETAIVTQGALWVTGRGLDLLRLDLTSGTVTAKVDVGPAAFGLALAGARIVVASYSARGARRGDPIVGGISLVDPARVQIVATIRPRTPTYLSGLAVSDRTLLTADTVTGRFVRLPLP
jgi:sugar lactone lactonase YvrE